MVDTMIGQPYGQEHERDETSREPQREGSEVPPGAPSSQLKPAKSLYLDNDHDLSRVGAWSLGLGGLGVLVGIAFLLAGGILPGALVVAVALICAMVGALSLALVAHHQG